MTLDKLIVYDRSRTVQDWKCGRSRYWQYEYNGKGIVTNHTALELYMGTAIHDALQMIATQYRDNGHADIDMIATTANTHMHQSILASMEGEMGALAYASEQAALVEGLIRGFYRQVWPQLMARYPIILKIEEEMVYNHDGLTFMAKPDLVVQDHDGEVWYIEYKSTSSKKEGWVNSWTTAVQLHSTIRAIEQTTKEKVTGVVVVGLYKGYQAYNKQTSPFCYAYKRQGNPPFSSDEISYEYKTGFKKYPTWELPGGVAAWVDAMPDNVLTEQFPITPPMFVKDDMIDAFFKQRTIRELEIHEAAQVLSMPVLVNVTREELLNEFFPQKFDQCIPMFGKPCAYRNLCFGHVSDPLTQGFQYRESHHELETEQDSLE